MLYKTINEICWFHSLYEAIDSDSLEGFIQRVWSIGASCMFVKPSLFY